MIFAIDPGSDKTGVAILQEDGKLVDKKIIMTETFSACLDEIYAHFPVTHIVMGNGTYHKSLQPVVENWIRQQQAFILFALVNEEYTTVEGRKLYWQHTPRHGWRRFVPLSFQYPPEPVDDFVAWIIGRRYIDTMGGK
jgi:hypothetical protein